LKDENGDLLAESHNILNRWKGCFSQLLTVHSISDVRQIYIQLSHQYRILSSLEVEIVIAKLKKYNSTTTAGERQEQAITAEITS
jgi:hypothetical protein